MVSRTGIRLKSDLMVLVESVNYLCIQGVISVHFDHLFDISLVVRDVESEYVHGSHVRARGGPASVRLHI